MSTFPAKEDFVENFKVYILTGRVGTLDPHQVTHKVVDTQLVAQGGLPRVLVGGECVPLLCDYLLGDVKVSPGNCHSVVVAHIVGAQPALKVDLCLRRQRRQECELTRQCYTATLDKPADNQPCLDNFSPCIES